MSLSDGVEILAEIKRLHSILATRCEDHMWCREEGCGETFCESCAIGVEPGYCGHGFPRCRDHWPAPECTDCADILREQAEYDARDKPWGAPA